MVPYPIKKNIGEMNLYTHKKITGGRKIGNVLFNDALNTFYLWLYGIRHDKEPLR